MEELLEYKQIATFPILGGRLLKVTFSNKFQKIHSVSNPWREAIEGKENGLFPNRKEVSNPWREAIEEALRRELMRYIEFPILGGRLLKPRKRHHIRP